MTEQTIDIAVDEFRAIRRQRARLPYGLRRLGPKHTPGLDYGPHTRRGPQRASDGDPATWQTTKRPPWLKRADSRRRNRAARIARRAAR